ncbi:sce7725 family protein [Paraclostridium bifermentans]|uniref:sce7725 family protein n=1 Tax=Paraclostridium bifermentans TaxID=1490 RepID=UPI00359C6B09
MYFPYLRGRQSELLALRELIEKDLIGEKIIPVIEITQVNSTFLKTLNVYLENNRKIAVIMNSKITNSENMIDDCMGDKLQETNIIKAYLVNSNLENEISRDLEYKDLLIINKDKDLETYFLDIFKDDYPMYSFIPYESRTLKKFIPRNKILLEDKFKKRKRNSDYTEKIDEFFSDDHIYFENENFKGFSDYSVIGEPYVEGGFAPYAVAIHIVYFDKNKELRIRHFVSDSNNDINNPAGKFKEAVKKLSEWMDEEECNSNFEYTYALNKFKEYYNLGKFPGLATIKKLSIMHHIELMNKFIEKELD